jgi:hypothetical protein
MFVLALKRIRPIMFKQLSDLYVSHPQEGNLRMCGDGFNKEEEEVAFVGRHPAAEVACKGRQI